jgi:hypothetical protein
VVLVHKHVVHILVSTNSKKKQKSLADHCFWACCKKKTHTKKKQKQKQKQKNNEEQNKQIVIIKKNFGAKKNLE